MRMSCNGCRVLRKGCSESCTLRPCLQWINSPESQANATVFLAKFYGRAGLINLINAGPDHLRPDIFKSLLYEACGRIINPVTGSVGLVWSGNWNRCQEAVEAVLNGSTIMQLPINDLAATADQVAAANYPITPFKGGDIRHLSKNSSDPIHRVKSSRNRFKRSGLHGKSPVDSESVADQFMNENEPAKFSIIGWECGDQQMVDDDELKRAPSHDSFSVETVEACLANRVDPVKSEEDCEIRLELTLG